MPSISHFVSLTLFILYFFLHCAMSHSSICLPIHPSFLLISHSSHWSPHPFISPSIHLFIPLISPSMPHSSPIHSSNSSHWSPHPSIPHIYPSIPLISWSIYPPSPHPPIYLLHSFPSIPLMSQPISPPHLLNHQSYSIHLSINSMHLPIHLCIHLPIHPSNSSTHPSIHPTHLPIHLPIHPSLCH